MIVLLIHHAAAVSPYEDPQRPLTEAGHQHALRLAELVKARDFVPALIWHSGKLRGRQTGHAFLQVCAPFAKFTMVKGVSPDDAPAAAVTSIQRESQDLAIVGHWPHLPALLRLLAPDSAPMPQHGAVALQTDDDGVTWRELWRESPS
jgi:phosphohistidine phosphatase